MHAAHEFDFSNGSVGNFFFAGARIFLNSLNAAIFLFSRVSGIARETEVLPALRSETDKVVVLGAELADGALAGQNPISHPAEAHRPGAATRRPTPAQGHGGAAAAAQSDPPRCTSRPARGACAQRGASAVEVAPPVHPPCCASCARPTRSPAAAAVHVETRGWSRDEAEALSRYVDLRFADRRGRRGRRRGATRPRS